MLLSMSRVRARERVCVRACVSDVAIRNFVCEILFECFTFVFICLRIDWKIRAKEIKLKRFFIR